MNKLNLVSYSRNSGSIIVLQAFFFRAVAPLATQIS